MADAPDGGTIEHRILLRLEAQTDALRDLAGNLGRVDRAVAGTQRQIVSLRRVGLAALVRSAHQSNQAFLKLTATVKNSGQTMDNMKSTLASIAKEAGKTTTSVQDAARAITELADASFAAQALLGALPETQKRVQILQEQLASQFGEQGVDAFKAFTAEMLSSGGGALELAKYLDKLDFDPKNIEGLRENLTGVALNSAEAGKKLQNIINMISSLGSGDENIDATRQWSIALMEVTKLWEKLYQIFVAKFGPILRSIITEIQEMIPYIKTAAESFMTTLLPVIGAVLLPIKAAFDFIKNILVTIGPEWAGWAAGAIAVMLAVSQLGVALTLMGGYVSGVGALFAPLYSAAKAALVAIVVSFQAVTSATTLSAGAMEMAGVAAEMMWTAIGGPVGVAIAAAIVAVTFALGSYMKSAAMAKEATDRLTESGNKNIEMLRQQAAKYKDVAAAAAHAGVVRKAEQIEKLEQELRDKEAEYEGFWGSINPLSGNIDNDEDYKGMKRQMDLLMAQRQKLMEKAKAAQATADEKAGPAKAATPEIPQSFEEARKAVAALGEGQHLQKFKLWEEQVTRLTPGMDGLASSADNLMKILETAGPQAMVETSEGMKTASEAVQVYRDDIISAMGPMKTLADLQMKQYAAFAKTVKDDPAKRLQAEEMKNKALATRNKYEALYIKLIELGAAELEVSLKRQQEITELHKTDLEISKGVYGTAGLSVRAYKQVVASLQEQKEIVAEQLKQHLADLEQTKDGEKARQDALEKVRKKQLELKKLTAEQVNMLKELRDGYLDAVQAQAFGAGAFEKILITQEQNLGKAMDKNLVKQNLRLGAVEDRARASQVIATRFSDQNYGLETMGGGEVDVEQQQRELAKNVPNDVVAQASIALAGEVINSTRGLSQVPDAAVAAAEALRDVAIAAKFGKTVTDALTGGAGGLKRGGPAGADVAAEQMRRAANAGSGGGGRGSGKAPKLNAGANASKAAKLAKEAFNALLETIWLFENSDNASNPISSESINNKTASSN